MSSDYIDKITASNGTTYDITGIFIAEYGITTFNEIEEAYNNGRLVFANYPSTNEAACFHSVEYDGSDIIGFVFRKINPNKNLQFIYCDIDDNWTVGVSTNIENTRVTVLENTKTTKYYPILAEGTGTATRLYRCAKTAARSSIRWFRSRADVVQSDSGRHMTT